MVKKFFTLVLSLMLVVALVPIKGAAREQNNPDVELWNVVNPLSTTITFLNTGAHPDDERSDLLAYLSRGLGVKTSSLIANRGEGGQNEIGNELGNALGIIRSNEMIEAAKINGVKAYHLSETTSDPIYDFGFSKSPEETLEKWGEELTYERLIRFIRDYQPDVVMPSFRNVASQHGHHRAMSILSERAFEDAADPTIFPEQIEEEGLSVWQVKKFYLPAESAETATTSIEIGDYDPIYEMSYPQLGEKSRYMHKSQGMGNDVPVAPRQAHLELIKSIYSDEDDDGIFTNIPYDFSDWASVVSEDTISANLADLQQSLDDIVDLYPNREAILPNAQKALNKVENLIEKVENGEIDSSLKKELLHKFALKVEQLQKVSLVASGLDIETAVESKIVTQGESTEINMSITNNGNQTINQIEASLLAPEGWDISSEDETKIEKLEPNESVNIAFIVQVTTNAAYYHPYDDSLIKASVSYKESGLITTNVLELDETIAVLPEVSVSPEPKGLVVNTADVKKEYAVKVKVKNYYIGEKDASVSLNLPDGWTSVPEKVDVNLKKRLEEKNAEFKIIPPSEVKEGNFSVDAIASLDNKQFDTTVQEIRYDHIKDSYFQFPSTMDGVAFELVKPDTLKIGYVESGFDDVPDYLLGLGFDVTSLTEADLSTGDLNQYDTIVTGIRANLSRADLVVNNYRLLEYAENGGHVVAQYHKPGDKWKANETPPYKLELGMPSIEWRVTDEDAPVTMTQPDHKLFNFPNKITDSDWDNWVQERGLYFPMNWDDRYETFVSMADPGEEAFDGGILMANYGEGTYLYTNLVFYRQMANQVPGGYRIFTNLLSYGVEESPETSASAMKEKVNKFAEEGEIEGEAVARSLVTHLTAVAVYEEQALGRKVVKHMESFKTLIDYYMENETITKKVHDSLEKDADALIEKWQ